VSRSLSFDRQCAAAGLPVPVPEYKFHPTRRWKFDWCLPEQRIAVECEGGSWLQGRHNRGSGFLADMEKYNEAAILGFRLLRVTPQQIANGQALTYLERLMATKTFARGHTTGCQ
jgi:hypothetical protein